MARRCQSVGTSSAATGCAELAEQTRPEGGAGVSHLLLLGGLLLLGLLLLGLRCRHDLEAALDLGELLGVLKRGVQQLVVDGGAGGGDGLLDGRQRGAAALLERDDGRGRQLRRRRAGLLLGGGHGESGWGESLLLCVCFS